MLGTVFQFLAETGKGTVNTTVNTTPIAWYDLSYGIGWYRTFERYSKYSRCIMPELSFVFWPFGWSVRQSYFPPPPQKNSEIILPFYYRSTCFSCRSSPAVAASNGKIYAIGGDQISEVNFYRARYEELLNIMYFWSEPSLLITLSVCLSIWALLWL